jgi:hypothetical protein
MYHGPGYKSSNLSFGRRIIKTAFIPLIETAGEELTLSIRIDIEVLATYHIWYDKEGSKNDNHNRIKRQKASI